MPSWPDYLSRAGSRKKEIKRRTRGLLALRGQGPSSHNRWNLEAPVLLLECGAEVAIYALGQGSLFKLEQGSPQTAAPSKRHGHNLGHSKNNHWLSVQVPELSAGKVKGKQYSRELRWAGQSSHVWELRGGRGCVIREQAIFPQDPPV